MGARNEQAAARKSATAARKRAAKKAPEPVEQGAVIGPDADGPPPGAEQPKGVFLIKQVDEQGNIQIIPQTVGVEVTEVQTIIEFGLRAFRQQIGLEGGGK